MQIHKLRLDSRIMMRNGPFSSLMTFVRRNDYWWMENIISCADKKLMVAVGHIKFTNQGETQCDGDQL